MTNRCQPTRSARSTMIGPGRGYDDRKGKVLARRKRFENYIATDGYREAHHDQRPHDNVEVDVERFEGGADQSTDHQHEKAVQELASKWFHRNILRWLLSGSRSTRCWICGLCHVFGKANLADRDHPS